jgi:hypothetical protein
MYAPRMYALACSAPPMDACDWGCMVLITTHSARCGSMMDGGGDAPRRADRRADPAGHQIVLIQGSRVLACRRRVCE